MTQKRSSQSSKPKLTPNGFTIEEEKRLLRAIKSTQKDICKGKAEKYATIDEALAALEK